MNDKIKEGKRQNEEKMETPKTPSTKKEKSVDEIIGKIKDTVNTYGKELKGGSLTDKFLKIIAQKLAVNKLIIKAMQIEGIDKSLLEWGMPLNELGVDVSYDLKIKIDLVSDLPSFVSLSLFLPCASEDTFMKYHILLEEVKDFLTYQFLWLVANTPFLEEALDLLQYEYE